MVSLFFGCYVVCRANASRGTYGVINLCRHTWFDRDLGIAGRVMIDNDGTYQNKLVKVSR